MLPARSICWTSHIPVFLEACTLNPGGPWWPTRKTRQWPPGTTIPSLPCLPSKSRNSETHPIPRYTHSIPSPSPRSLEAPGGYLVKTEVYSPQNQPGCGGNSEKVNYTWPTAPSIWRTSHLCAFPEASGPHGPSANIRDNQEAKGQCRNR